MIAHLTAAQIAALIIVVAGAIIDLRTLKIPNWLTFPAAVLGIGLQWWHSGPAGVVWAVAGWLTGAGISIAVKMTPVVLGRYKEVPIGYGDTKLIASVGACLGPGQVLLVYWYFCLWYGFIWLFQLLRTIPWIQISLLFMLPRGSAGGQAINAENLRGAGKQMLPIGPAIAAGTACAIFFEKATLHFFGFGQ